MNQLDMIELQRTRQRKNKRIRGLGYNLVEVYECEILKTQRLKNIVRRTTSNS